MSLGMDFVLPELLAARKKNQAMQFVLANASLVVGWKQAGLSRAGLASALARLGYPVTAKHAGALYARAQAVADPGKAREIAMGLNDLRLASALRAQGPAPEAPPQAAALPAIAPKAAPAPRAPVYLKSPAPTEFLKPGEVRVIDNRNRAKSPDHG